MRHSLSLVGALVVALVLSQFPEYAQQYTQRLGGAVEELRIITAEFDAAAAEAGLNREAALNRYAVAGDVFIEGRGRSMSRTFARYADLSARLESIRGADPVERLALLPDYFDSEIGAQTLATYKPAVPVTVEGFAYAGAGLLAGYLIVSGLLRLLFLPFRRRRHARGDTGI